MHWGPRSGWSGSPATVGSELPLRQMKFLSLSLRHPPSSTLFSFLFLSLCLSLSLSYLFLSASVSLSLSLSLLFYLCLCCFLSASASISLGSQLQRGAKDAGNTKQDGLILTRV